MQEPLMAGPALRQLALERTRDMVRRLDEMNPEQDFYAARIGGHESAARREARLYEKILKNAER